MSGNHKWIIPATIRSHPVGLVIGRNVLSLANPGNQESQPYFGELRARPAPTACPPVGLPLNGPISCQVQMAFVWPCCHTKCLGRISRDTQVAESAAGDVLVRGWCEAMVTASGGGATEDTGGGRGGTTGSIESTGALDGPKGGSGQGSTEAGNGGVEAGWCRGPNGRLS